MNFLLTINPEDYNSAIIETKGFMETLGFGGQMLLLGIGTVFAVLAIIWLALLVFQFVFSGKKENSGAAATVVTAPAPAAVDTAADDGEVIAAIAAAIAMAESENDNIKFRVVSFRRK